jgi:hypothetical protein
MANLSAYDFKDDVLILAGDISDRRNLPVESFETFSKKFFSVIFVPGNHDL